VRLDDLILSEEQYPQGPCESKQEWLLMYSRGVSVQVIAMWCRVELRRVNRAVNRHARHSPSWFDHCLRIHDQPAPSRNKRNTRPSREQLWQKQYADLAEHVRERGKMPAQNDSEHSRKLYRWVEAQRRQDDVGNLTQDKRDALDRLGDWQGIRRGPGDGHWDKRLSDVHRFRDLTGRFPIYDPERRPDERLLAVWVTRQRTWARTGRLRFDRRQRLTAMLPDWMPPEVASTAGRGKV
jgi:hypothetical protein